MHHQCWVVAEQLPSLGLLDFFEVSEKRYLMKVKEIFTESTHCTQNFMVAVFKNSDLRCSAIIIVSITFPGVRESDTNCSHSTATPLI